MDWATRQRLKTAASVVVIALVWFGLMGVVGAYADRVLSDLFVCECSCPPGAE